MSRVGACKCGADTIEDHDGAVRNGYPGHVYTGHYWCPKENTESEGDWNE